jgi:hypothetical protein
MMRRCRWCRGCWTEQRPYRARLGNTNRSHPVMLCGLRRRNCRGGQQATRQDRDERQLSYFVHVNLPRSQGTSPATEALSLVQAPSRGFFIGGLMKRSWRDEYRRCERCKADYHPQRQSQSYCSPACRRAAAYGRERFAAGTTGRRRRRLEASDNAQGTHVAGSVRNGDFSPIETISCKATNLSIFPLSASGLDARFAAAGRCFRRGICRATCSVSQCVSARRRWKEKRLQRFAQPEPFPNRRLRST